MGNQPNMKRISVDGVISEVEKLPDGRFNYDAKNDLWIYRGRPFGALHHAGADGMDAIESQVDGKMYDSRSAYMRSLKDSGHHIVDKGYRQKKKSVVDSKHLENCVGQAMHQLGISE